MRPLKAIETAEAWARGDSDVSLDDVRKAAARAAYAAARAARAAYAAYAAARAAYAAADAATDAATDAADAATDAAYAADAARAAADAARAATDAADAYARTRILAECADHVRAVIPLAVVEAALSAEISP